MTPLQAVDEYVALTAQIKELNEKRVLLRRSFKAGRNIGTCSDVRSNCCFYNRLDIALLRCWVTKQVLDRCLVPVYKTTNTVVNKLKPKKAKNV